MSVVLSFILFGCTLLVMPALFFGVFLIPVDDAGLCAIIITLILSITAGLTVYFKKDFGFGFCHCAVPFVILTVMCYLNPMNSGIVWGLTYRWLPRESVEILDGRIASSLFFSIPMTGMSILTLAAAALINRVKERNYYR